VQLRTNLILNPDHRGVDSTEQNLILWIVRGDIGAEDWFNVVLTSLPLLFCLHEFPVGGMKRK
jgi:hypothetical protein